MSEQIRFQRKFPHVRAAIPEDFNSIMQLCRQLYAENGAVDVDWPIVESVIIDGVNGRKSCLGVVGEPGHVEGMLYLRISRMWYSSKVILEEIYNYVAPDFRRSRNSEALIKFAKSSADRLKVPLLIGVISNERTEPKMRYYRRHLGEPAGGFWLYGATTGGR